MEKSRGMVIGIPMQSNMDDSQFPKLLVPYPYDLSSKRREKSSFFAFSPVSFIRKRLEKILNYFKNFWFGSSVTMSAKVQGNQQSNNQSWQVQHVFQWATCNKVSLIKYPRLVLLFKCSGGQAISPNQGGRRNGVFVNIWFGHFFHLDYLDGGEVNVHWNESGIGKMSCFSRGVRYLSSWLHDVRKLCCLRSRCKLPSNEVNYWLTIMWHSNRSDQMTYKNPL